MVQMMFQCWAAAPAAAGAAACMTDAGFRGGSDGRVGTEVAAPPHKDVHFSRMKCLLCSTADKRPGWQFNCKNAPPKITANIPPKANFEKDTCMNFFGLEAFTVLKFWAVHLAVHWAVQWAYFSAAHFSIKLPPLFLVSPPPHGSSLGSEGEAEKKSSSCF